MIALVDKIGPGWTILMFTVCPWISFYVMYITAYMVRIITDAIKKKET